MPGHLSSCYGTGCKLCALVSVSLYRFLKCDSNALALITSHCTLVCHSDAHVIVHIESVCFVFAVSLTRHAVLMVLMEKVKGVT